MRDASASVVLTADGSRTLMRAQDGESFKSLAGALTEARAVYLEGSGVGERLRGGAPCRVLEVGFGSGLNFLVTAAEAQRGAAQLDYRAVERRPPAAELLEELRYADLLAPSPLPPALVAWRRSLGATPAPGAHRLEHGGVLLTLLVGDARHLALDPDADLFDAVYHDAFSPATNPELWSEPFLRRLAALLAPGGRLVSFTVAGAVRRALSAAGLDVFKVPGPPGGKREVLVAVRSPVSDG